jgi:hypothetical protein
VLLLLLLLPLAATAALLVLLQSITADFPTDADAPALAAEARMNL